MAVTNTADLPDQLMQQLYLLEVMVDQVTLASDQLPGCPCEEISNLSVRVKFFDFPCLDIRQAEFGHHERRGEFSSGKSLLFPMEPLDLVRALQYFPLAVSVVLPRPKARLPRVLGVCTVALPDHMVDAVRRARVCCAHQQEAILKDDFNLVQLTGQPAGTLRLFIRLSCLGQTLVTEFDADSSLLSLNVMDTSPACPGCFSRAEPTDPQALDVYPAPPLLSEHEPCCPKVSAVPLAGHLLPAQACIIYSCVGLSTGPPTHTTETSHKSGDEAGTQKEVHLHTIW